jgi:hypothetical protein
MQGNVVEEAGGAAGGAESILRGTGGVYGVARERAKVAIRDSSDRRAGERLRMGEARGEVAISEIMRRRQPRYKFHPISSRYLTAMVLSAERGEL